MLSINFTDAIREPIQLILCSPSPYDKSAGLVFLMATMRKLPFLNGIRACEAAARADGSAKAATELHVTPAAISRMVQLLEQRLGVPLFERKANRLALTAGWGGHQGGLQHTFRQTRTLAH